MSSANFIDVAAQKRFSPEKMQKVNLFETDRSILDIYCLEPGQAQKVHAHAGEDKYYYVLEGRALIQIGTEQREVGPGWAAVARAGVEHGVSNPGQEQLVLLVCMTPKPAHLK